MSRYLASAVIGLLGGYILFGSLVGQAPINVSNIMAVTVGLLMVFGTYGGIQTVVIGHIPTRTRWVMAGMLVGAHTFLWLRHFQLA